MDGAFIGQAGRGAVEKYAPPRQRSVREQLIESEERLDALARKMQRARELLDENPALEELLTLLREVGI